MVAKKGTLKWRNEVRQLVTQAVRQPHGKLTENDDYFDYHPNVVQTKLFTVIRQATS